MEEKKIKIEIKNRFTGKVLFEYEKVNNTVKDTLVEAVKCCANLRGADLRDANLVCANLRDANLVCANLRGVDLRDANLVCAYLRDANLVCANLRDANLRCANLVGAYLRGADLGGADLRCAYLRGADLGGADLRCADLRGADLGGADLRGAYLGGADLGGADFGGAYLGGAKNVPFIPFACPSDGAFIGWKKVNGLLVKLEIPEDARRCSATGRKCRCDNAKVLKIIDPEDETKVIDEVVNKEYAKTVYKVGENVYPDSFDENRWNECSHGIHFFINKQDAIDY